MSRTSDQDYSVREIANRMHMSEGTVTRMLGAVTLRGRHAGTAAGMARQSCRDIPLARKPVRRRGATPRLMSVQFIHVSF
jgi:hypothetical protein